MTRTRILSLLTAGITGVAVGSAAFAAAPPKPSMSRPSYSPPRPSYTPPRPSYTPSAPARPSYTPSAPARPTYTPSAAARPSPTPPRVQPQPHVQRPVPHQSTPARPQTPTNPLARGPYTHPHPVPGNTRPIPHTTHKPPNGYVTPRKPLPATMGQARLPGNRLPPKITAPRLPAGKVPPMVLAARTPHVPVYIGKIVQTTPPPVVDLARNVSASLSAGRTAAAVSESIGRIADAVAQLGMGRDSQDWVLDQVRLAGVGDEQVEELDAALSQGDAGLVDEQLAAIGAGPSFRQRVANMEGIQQAWDRFQQLNQSGAGSEELGSAMNGVVEQLDQATQVGNLPGLGDAQTSEEYSIALANPKDTGMAISFLLDGQEMTLEAGQCLKLKSGKTYDVIFDRGGDFGESGFTLFGGRYDFEVGDQGVQLFKQ